MADGLEKNTQRSKALNVARGRIPSPSRARPRGAQTALSPVSDEPQRAGRARDTRNAQAPTRGARSGRASGAARPIAGLPHLPAYQRRAAEGARPKPRSHWLRRHRPDPAALCGRQQAAEAPGLATPGPTTTPASPAGSRGASTLLGPPPPSVLRPVRSSSNTRLSSCSRKLDRRPDCCPASFPRAPREGRRHSHHQQVPVEGERGMRGRPGEMRGLGLESSSTGFGPGSVSNYHVTLDRFFPLWLCSPPVKCGGKEE